MEDWQLKQAEEAIRIYLEKFSCLKGNSQKPKIRKDSSADEQKIINDLKNAIRLKHFAYSTERTYVDWAKRFFEYLMQQESKNIALDSLNSQDVRNFLNMLAVEQRISASSQNQAFNALLFLFRNVFNLELKEMDKTVRAKRGVKLPVVLSIAEVQKIMQNMEGMNLLLVRTLYGTGMRLMELARLRVKDIDFGSNLIFVRAGKGDKDRATMLPELIRNDLKNHLREVEKVHQEDLKAGFGEVFLPEALSRKYPQAGKDWAWQYVFPSAKLSVDPRSGKIKRHHISPSTIQKTVANAVRKAGIAKQVSVHTFRHSFATHLMMNGVNIREIQDLLGHKHVETTMIYTHVMRNMSNAPKSPLDTLLEG
ncbi:MAG: integron integrase [Candidatus Omnitrophica bacterium]|nr:integron integrase [Candidatus Omnitrophota bacterium]